MTKSQIQNFWESLVTPQNIKSIIQERKKEDIYAKILPKDVDQYKEAGWEIDRVLRNGVRVKKPKAIELSFEDEVWSLFANLGFTYLNKDRNFRMPYSENSELTQRISVFAADSETILFVECKAFEGDLHVGNLQDEIENIGTKKEGIHKAIRTFFPDFKYKIKFILATKNYYVTENETEHLENYDIVHFDEETLQYYQDLTKHLGISARFQLLGNLFEGQEIPELQNKIPAIEGKMGGHTYYSFSIEPEKLLKISYVLHRNKANLKLMPTYQRLIKRSRLNSIQSFVDSGGFFPNSIIINISTTKKLKFEMASTQVENAVSKVGILYLPKQYRSAFIIDGQHRLYGYANSKYQKTNSIPVVAFLNLDRTEQVKIFMQINENQKAVPKNLRNTLNSDLLWNSENRIEQVSALKLAIAQDLGEDRISPLFDKIIVGENPKTLTRCITIDTIRIGLDRSNFFGQFTKYAVREIGTFYKGNNDDTNAIILPFLKLCFNYVKTNLPEEWAKGEMDNGILTINAGIENLIRIFSDIIDHLVTLGKVDPKKDSTETLLSEVSYYLEPLIEYFKNLKPDQKTELRKSYGTGGRARYWRILQKSINDVRTDFEPKGLVKYWKDEAKAFNEESFKMIRDLETFMKEDFKAKLKEHFGETWFKEGLPKPVYDDSIKRAADKNYEVKIKSEEVDAWDCLNIIDYRKIATYGKNWSEIFEKHYTKPGEEKISGGKDAKTSWMQKLERIRNQNFHSYSVKEEEYDFLCELNEWLIEKKVDNEYA